MWCLKQTSNIWVPPTHRLATGHILYVNCNRTLQKSTCISSHFSKSRSVFSLCSGFKKQKEKDLNKMKKRKKRKRKKKSRDSVCVKIKFNNNKQQTRKHIRRYVPTSCHSWSSCQVDIEADAMLWMREFETMIYYLLNEVMREFETAFLIFFKYFFIDTDHLLVHW